MTDRRGTDSPVMGDRPEPAELALVFGCVEPEGSLRRATGAIPNPHLRTECVLTGGGSERSRRGNPDSIATSGARDGCKSDRHGDGPRPPGHDDEPRPVPHLLLPPRSN